MDGEGTAQVLSHTWGCATLGIRILSFSGRATKRGGVSPLGTTIVMDWSTRGRVMQALGSNWKEGVFLES